MELQGRYFDEVLNQLLNLPPTAVLEGSHTCGFTLSEKTEMARNSVGVGVGFIPAVSAIPAGLQALYSACGALYTDQPNPLQVAAVVKYW